MPEELHEHPLRRPEARVRRHGTAAAAAGAAVAGALLLFAGYWGASDTNVPADQIPYLASSTIPGLALIAAAAVLLVRREHERDREELRALCARFDAVVDWLTSGEGDQGDSSVPTAGANGGEGRRKIPSEG